MLIIQGSPPVLRDFSVYDQRGWSGRWDWPACAGRVGI